MRVVANPRQVLSERRGAMASELLDAGLAELREHGYEQLTIRGVAGRAGVTHTTAYNYFGSKAHLAAEIYWRALQSVPATSVDNDTSLADRIHQALGGPALVVRDEPELAQAALAALLTDDPEVRRLRDAIGADLAARIVGVLDADASPALTDVLLLAFSGAMLQAGMGYFDFDGVVARMDSLAALLEGR